ncbi:SDR family NAD(P)-dependent oxidoreductase, partial [Candidatus Entotheonella palauensis]|uniref:SDR family NAD(P)-dependent oxidoreductase n=1 Tax=Candidatus Entotheonella palauensis TaxID=93172 RepID=UPI001177926D
MRLAGKVAIVTGSANGMGEVEAHLFSKEGAKVIVADMSVEGGQKVAEAIAAAGGEARFAQIDVTSEDDWQETVKTAVSVYGKLDILVNNAGISGTYQPDTLSTEAWDRVMAINAKGVFLGMKHAIPEMQRNGGGSIVNISSISGFAGQDGIHMAYNASKGAVRIMTKSAAVQYAKDRIRVNSVHPGIMPAMTTSVLTADPEMRAKMLAQVPMGREGRREEVGY